MLSASFAPAVRAQKVTLSVQADAPGKPRERRLLGQPQTGACRVRDLWGKRWLGTFRGEFAPLINWHGAGLYRVSGRRS